MACHFESLIDSSGNFLERTSLRAPLAVHSHTCHTLFERGRYCFFKGLMMFFCRDLHCWGQLIKGFKRRESFRTGFFSLGRSKRGETQPGLSVDEPLLKTS